MAETPHWYEEFSEEFRPDQPVLDLLQRDGVQDQSWHNDACPHIERVSPSGGVACLWFHHPIVERREFPCSRYQVELINPATDEPLVTCGEDGGDYFYQEFEDATEAAKYFLQL